jgi:uncharacterized protein (DUF1015 family)
MAHPAASSATRRALELRPFRALRYDTDRVGALWDVTSPPYDVLDAEIVDELLHHPYNVVRLILPRRRTADVSPYTAVAHLLASWRASGALRLDPTPGLYVYEYAEDGDVVRGLVGGVGIYRTEEQVVLPHEEVMAQPVSDRLELMRATSANLEPILCVYDGGGAASEVVERTATRPTLAAATTPTGCQHRIWQISDAEELAAIAADLAPRQALIADGHHRYATYRRLSDERPAQTSAQVGLALLVDQQRHPLHVGAIHRSVASLQWNAIDRSDLQLRARSGRTAALAALPTSAFALTDGSSWYTATRESPESTPAHDIAALHEHLLRTWNVQESDIGYFHDVDAAVRAAVRTSGIAVLTRAVGVADVMATARAGRRMPRKSTSFAPKPRMGLLMRTLDH